MAYRSAFAVGSVDLSPYATKVDTIAKSTGGTFTGNLGATGSIFEGGVALSAKYALQTNVVPVTGGTFTGSTAVVNNSVATTSLVTRNTLGTAVVQVHGMPPYFRLIDDSGAVDQTTFDMSVNGGEWLFVSQNDAVTSGTALFRAQHGGGLQVGVPAGGDKGFGTLNAGQLWENNVRVQTISDERHKLDILPLKAGLSDIRTLANVVSEWGWRDPDQHHGEPGEGFPAQALEAAGFGHLVITDNPGTEHESKRVDKAMPPIVARLINAVCELSDEITTLKARLA